MEREIFHIHVEVAGAWHPATAELLRANRAALLRLEFLVRVFEDSGYDYFNALQKIRRRLEPEAIKVVCYGASRNVYPSAMSSQMSEGRMAYRTAMGQTACSEDLVDTF